MYNEFDKERCGTRSKCWCMYMHNKLSAEEKKNKIKCREEYKVGMVECVEKEQRAKWKLYILLMRFFAQEG